MRPVCTSLYVMEGERAARDEGGPAESHVPEGMSKNQWKKMLKKRKGDQNGGDHTTTWTIAS